MLALVAIATLLAACTRHSRPATNKALAVGPSPAELAALSIPPGATSEDALRSLEIKADRGSAQAAWERAHYLLDLFDSTRFAHDEASRALLAQTTGRPLDAMRGPAATQAIAELLVLEVDHVLELDRQHSPALQAQTLARIDAVPPKNRSEVFQHMQELKRIARGESLVATGASLRLFAHCRSALVDASQFSGPGRRVALSHCLYPLFDADPEPYFHNSPSQRPPPPTFDRLHSELKIMLSAEAMGRLAKAFAAQRTWLEEFDNENRLRFAQLDPIAARLASVDIATPSDDYPIVELSAAPEARAKLRRSLSADGRRIAAVAIAADAPVSKTLEAASAAAKAGAQQLSLLVAIRQRLSVPTGDYWSQHLSGDSVTRLGDLKISLALLGADKAPVGEDSQVRVGQWNPDRSKLKLYLLISPKKWRLVSPDGELAVINTGVGHPRVALWYALQTILSAYPDETGLVLVPSKETTHGTLVMVAEAARHDPDGVEFLADLALSPTAPKVKKGKALRQRVARRAAAKVSVVPESLAPRLPIARRCYLEVLARPGKARSGEIRMDLDSAGKLTLTKPGSLLADCAARAFAGPMGDEGITAVSVSFTQ